MFLTFHEVKTQCFSYLDHLILELLSQWTEESRICKSTDSFHSQLKEACQREKTLRKKSTQKMVVQSQQKVHAYEYS